MPTSAIGSCDPSPRPALLTTPPPALGRGFTLIELLVVLVILGVLSTTVALSVAPDPQRQVKLETQRLALVLEAAMLEAQAGRRQLAWSADAEAYSFWEAERSDLRERLWKPLTEDERFGRRRFGAGLRLVSVEVDGQSLPPGALLAFQRGDPPLFRIALAGPGGQTHSDQLIELRGTPTGRVDIRTVGNP